MRSFYESSLVCNYFHKGNGETFSTGGWPTVTNSIPPKPDFSDNLGSTEITVGRICMDFAVYSYYLLYNRVSTMYCYL